MPNPYDQFDSGSSQTAVADNPYDQFDPVQSNPYDQFDTPPSSTPATDAAAGIGLGMDLVQSQIPGVRNLEDAIGDTVKSLPQMLAKFPEYAYHGAKIAAGQEHLDQALKYLVQESAPQAAGLLQGIKSPVGSREFDAALIQLGLMAAPAVELARGVRGGVRGVEKPPVQVEAPPVQTTVEPEISPVIAPGQVARFQPPQTTADITRFILNRNRAINAELSPLLQQQETMRAAGLRLDPGAEARIAELQAELAKPSIPEGGEQYASSQQTATEMGLRGEGGEVGPSTSLRQPGETAPIQGDVGVGPSEPQAQEAPVSGISTERLQQVYGKDSVLINKGKGPQEWQRIGQADTRDPYAVLSQSRTQGIATPEDAALLRAEHQRLLADARASYGSPEYNEKMNRAVDMANAIKQVAHGPASDLMRGFQEMDIPRYDSAADFDAIVRERMGRESTPDETGTFEKIASEIRNGDSETARSATTARTRLRQSRPRAAKEPMKFDDAADYIRKQIEELTKECAL